MPKINPAIRTHSVVLLWHGYNPAWLENLSGDSTAFEAIMKTHIQTVVTHFKGKVAAWDVVNEAFTDNGGYRTTESIWYKKLGKDYIAVPSNTLVRRTLRRCFYTMIMLKKPIRAS
jgi:endo-1,4-beta-xylanase